ncbi:MAG: O-methyltransferase [Actinomycetota bacterium]|nr:O-methyltransferase [Actinomycetota bacterium]
MTEELWSAVDAWFTDRLLPDDPALTAAVERARRAGLPDIAVSPVEGRFLHLLARISGARRVLEIGTLGGYSTIWLARALPADGRVVTLEIDPTHAATARESLDAAGIGDRVEILVGPALRALPTLSGPFDLVFVDADKQNNPAYVRAALELSRPGTVLVVDNVVRGGGVLDADTRDEMLIGARAVTELAGSDPRLEATALQTVGPKGYDGFLLALVR